MAGKVRSPQDSVLRREQSRRDDLRLQRLQEIDSFREVPAHELRWLGRNATLRVFADQATIVTERMPNDFLYIVLRGTVTVDLHDRLGKQVSLGILPVGAIFGESPLHGTHFSGVSVVARSPSELLQIPIEALRHSQSQLPVLYVRLQELYRQRLVRATLARVPFLAVLNDAERHDLMNKLLVRDVPRGEYIVMAGHPPNGLHVIESGQFVIERQGQVIAHLDEGDFIGALAMMTNTVAHDDVRAITPCQVLTLPGSVFLEMLDHHPEISASITTMLRDRSHYFEKQYEIIDEITRRGIRRGDHVLVREWERCPPGCRLCIDACTQRHGAPRLSHDGVVYGDMVVLDSCRQCRVGAECVEICPVDAIVWDGPKLVITEACTGCGTCVRACNYAAITLEPRDRSWVGSIRRTLQQIPIIPLTVHQPEYRASKCDMCAGYTDLACSSICPIGALKVIPVESIFPY
jgi:CRP-like cAMP-binding protein/Fe-S-cluster-containing hydrogenase component 2